MWNFLNGDLNIKRWYNDFGLRELKTVYFKASANPFNILYSKDSETFSSYRHCTFEKISHNRDAQVKWLILVIRAAAESAVSQTNPAS